MWISIAASGAEQIIHRGYSQHMPAVYQPAYNSHSVLPAMGVNSSPAVKGINDVDRIEAAISLQVSGAYHIQLMQIIALGYT